MKQHLIHFFLWLTLIVGISCSVKNPTEQVSTYPSLSALSLPEAVYPASDSVFTVSVRVSDPQGVDDIQFVTLSIELSADSTMTDTLADNGEGGDIIPKDGLYFRRISTAIFENPGMYAVEIHTQDRGLASAFLLDTLHVMAGVRNTPPVLSQAVFPDSLNDETVEDVQILISVTDADGAGDIDSVWFEMYTPFSPAPVLSWPLRDDGLQGDPVAGDGQYGFWANLYYSVRISGVYTLRIAATDQAGERSILLNQFYVNRPNDAPVIRELSVPDIVGLSAGRFKISIHVEDAQGPEDIKSIYFNSTKPDGTSAAGNPFFIYHYGEEIFGATVENDGWYSLDIEITRQNDPGEYIFDFFAKDQSGLVSAMQSDTITVILD